MTSAGGSETFLFLASRTALPDLEARLGDATTAHEGATVHDTRFESQSGSTRGVDGLAPSRIATDAPNDRLESLVRFLASRADSSVWVERIVVANPGP